MTRRVLVVGGGIAGFAVLRALARRGIEASLVDRVGAPPEGGLGLNLPANGVRALRALGVEGELPGVPVRRREYRTGTGRLLFAVDEAAFWGAPDGSVCLRRGELLGLLRAGRSEPDVRWNVEVTAVTGSGVRLADGSTEEYDLIVGADGVGSAVRAAVVPDATSTASLLSRASWRFMAPNPGVDCWTVWSGPGAGFLLIPVAEGVVYGYASAVGGGAIGAEPDWLRDTFGDYPEPVRTTLTSALADPAALYHSPVREIRIPRWHAGRTVLVGDAAHATAPVWAQGGALALEDALTLAELLAESTDWAAVGARYEAARRPRVQHVQAMTDRFAKAAGLPGWLRNSILPIVGPRTYRAAYGPLR